jgi:small subunit ribosomal protein S2
MTVATDIVKAKVYVWQPKNKSNPKTRDSWLGVFNGMVVFDPALIEEQLKAAKALIADTKKSNGEILVICEKSLYKEELETLSAKVWFHYLNHKVPAWVMTNFDTLLGRIRSLKDLRSFMDSSALETLTKKEQSMKKRELAKVEQVYKGVVNLKKKPDLVVIVDGQFMSKFVLEIQKLNSKAVVLASSDFDKWVDQQVVMCNTNSFDSIDYVLHYLFG